MSAGVSASVPEAPTADLREAARCALRLAAAPSERAARAILVGCVGPLGPWAERLLFDVNVGAARLEDSDLRLAGDLMLGWQGDDWGTAARGGLATYDLGTATRISQTEKVTGDAELWGVLLGHGDTRVEGRFVAELVAYNTDNVDLTGTFVLDDEDSLQIRSKGLLGIRFEPGSRLALGAWAGGSFLFEYYIEATRSRSSSAQAQPCSMTPIALQPSAFAVFPSSHPSLPAPPPPSTRRRWPARGRSRSGRSGDGVPGSSRRPRRSWSRSAPRAARCTSAAAATVADGPLGAPALADGWARTE